MEKSKDMTTEYGKSTTQSSEDSKRSSESDKGKIPFEDGESDYFESNRTRFQKVIHYMKQMRMEPGLLIYMTASMMGNIMASDLQLDRACRVNKGYNDSICDTMMGSAKRQSSFEEDEVQKVISEIGIWSEIVENFFPILFSLFLGTWSDVYGVKLPFLLSVGGVAVRYGGLLLCVYYSTWDAQIVSLFSTLPGSLTGGRIAISMVVYSFVSITSTLKERTIRVGILTAVRTFGKSAGSALGGHLKRSGKDYYFIFGIGGGLAVSAFVYTLLFMPNPKKGSNPCGFKTNSKTAAMKNLFNFRNIIECAKAFFKKREYGIRTQLYLLVIVLIFTMAPMQGEDSVLLLFVRKQLTWSTATYAEYGTFRMLIAFGGGLVSMGLLTKMMKLADWKIGVISCISQIAGSLIYAFAKTDLMMYIAPIVDILNGTMIIAARTMISKISPVEEMGKINAFVAVIDSTTPLWGNPLYNAIYRGTLESFAGAFFILSAVFTVPPMILFTYFGLSKKGIPIHEQAQRKRRLEGAIPEL